MIRLLLAALFFTLSLSSAVVAENGLPILVKSVHGPPATLGGSIKCGSCHHGLGTETVAGKKTNPVFTQRGEQKTAVASVTAGHGKQVLADSPDVVSIPVKPEEQTVPEVAVSSTFSVVVNTSIGAGCADPVLPRLAGNSWGWEVTQNPYSTPGRVVV